MTASSREATGWGWRTCARRRAPSSMSSSATAAPRPPAPPAEEHRGQPSEVAVSDTAEYRPLEGLPTPALVVRGDQVVYANPALLTLLGLGLEEVQATPGPELLARFSPEDRAWLQPMHEDYTREKTAPDTVWLRVREAGGEERTWCMRRGSGLRP